MEFKVKKDFLLVFLVNVLLAFLVCIAIPFAYNTWVFIVVFTVCLAILVFYDTSVIFASCKVENDVLTYRTGVFSYKINLNTIVSVERSKNLYGSLALSCDRVRIVTNLEGKNKVYYVAVCDNEKLMSVISPKQATVTPAVEVETKEKTAPAKKTTSKTATTKKATQAKKATATKKAANTKTKTTTSKK